MSKADYLHESLSIAFDDCGAWLVWEGLSKDQQDFIAGALEGSIDNMSMAMGYDCIPNPLASELSRVKSTSKSEIERLESVHDDQIKELRTTIYSLNCKLNMAHCEIEELRRR